MGRMGAARPGLDAARDAGCRRQLHHARERPRALPRGRRQGGASRDRTLADLRAMGSMQIRGYREEARCAGLVLLATFMSMTPSMAAVDGHPARAPAPEGSRCTSYHAPLIGRRSTRVRCLDSRDASVNQRLRVRRARVDAERREVREDPARQRAVDLAGQQAQLLGLGVARPRAPPRARPGSGNRSTAPGAAASTRRGSPRRRRARRTSRAGSRRAAARRRPSRTAARARARGRPRRRRR